MTRRPTKVAAAEKAAPVQPSETAEAFAASILRPVPGDLAALAVGASSDPADALDEAGEASPAAFSPIVRIRSLRPVYRRGGLVFDGQGEIEVAPADMNPADVLELLQDPVLTIQGEIDGSWRPLPPEIRAGLVDVIRQHLAGPSAED